MKYQRSDTPEQPAGIQFPPQEVKGLGKGICHSSKHTGLRHGYDVHVRYIHTVISAYFGKNLLSGAPEAGRDLWRFFGATSAHPWPAQDVQGFVQPDLEHLQGYNAWGCSSLGRESSLPFSEFL